MRQALLGQMLDRRDDHLVSRAEVVELRASRQAGSLSYRRPSGPRVPQLRQARHGGVQQQQAGCRRPNLSGLFASSHIRQDTSMYVSKFASPDPIQ
ncbi:hypothetical protein GCM10023146_41560 [Nocardioides caricicola]